MYGALITLTSNNSLKILRDKGKNVYYENQFKGCTPTCMTFSKQLSTIVLGTAEGKLIFTNWPILEEVEMNKFNLLDIDSNPITEIKFSW